MSHITEFTKKEAQRENCVLRVELQAKARLKVFYCEGGDKLLVLAEVARWLARENVQDE